MDTDKHGCNLNDLTHKIISCIYKVSNKLGCGFLEKVYENALCYELKKTGFNVDQQYNMKIKYESVVVGEYCADILVDNKILVELKCIKEFDPVHVAQCINYLKALELKLCLLINFGKPKVDIKRIAN